MLSKLICTLLVIYLSTPCMCYYSCITTSYGEPTKKVNVDGMVVECPGNTVCNEFSVPGGICVSPYEMCGNKFRCNGNTVLLGTGQFDCGAGFRCNRENQYPCKACVVADCPKPTFTCPGPTDRDVSQQGLKLTCDQYSKCNKHNQQPCNPCVNRYTGMATAIVLP